jgi:hypothetical protein
MLRKGLWVSLLGALAVMLSGAVAAAHDPDELATADTGMYLRGFSLEATFPAGDAGARPTSSDIAFWGDLAYVGNYNGFRIFDVSSRVPVQLSDVRCVGAQGDPSVFDRDGDGAADTLVLSVDRTMTKATCDGVPTANHADPNGWEGLRIFDVSDPRTPAFLGAVYQDCGSHTNTLLPVPTKGKEAADSIYVLNSSYPLRPGPTCGPQQSARAANHGVVQVVEIPFANPKAATEVAELPIVYPGDPDGTYRPVTEHGLGGGAVGGSGLLDDFLGCHDLSVFPSEGIVGAACGEQAQVWEIDKKTGLPDTRNPRWVYDQPNVDFWHSATFSWDGKVANFIDESFGDGCPTTTVKRDLSTPAPDDVKEFQTGNMFFFDTKRGTLLSEFRIPRGTNDGRTGPNQYCSSHLGIPVPARDRYLLVNAYYRGGSSVIDFSDPYRPEEIAWADLANTDTWSAYTYPRAHERATTIPVYSNDGVHTPNDAYGFQRFTAEVGAVDLVGLDRLNPQLQERSIKTKLAREAKPRPARTFATGRPAKPSDARGQTVRDADR